MLSRPYTLLTRLKRVVVRSRQKQWIRGPHAFLKTHPRLAPAVFFCAGVLWDLLTLQRIDDWVDNLLLLVYLIFLGGLIVLSTRVAYNQASHPRLLRYQDFYPAAIQFLFGTLFSAYVVFYAQSANAFETSFFLGVLVVLLIANEFIRNRLTNLYILIGLYFLASFSFFIFFIPVLSQTVSYATFLLSGLLSLGLVGLFILYLRRVQMLEASRYYGYAAGIVLTLFGLMQLFYAFNWIPPVPLAMREGGIYHHVSKASDTYVLRYEPASWYHPRSRTASRFHYAPGDTVFCFASIFAPTGLVKGAYHRWLYYDQSKESWVETDRIAYQQPIVGARDLGYRGYTYKRNIQMGKWRVDVMTEDHRILGRVRFHVVPVRDGHPTIAESRL